MISRIIKVSVRVISLSLRLRLITLTSTLIILDITKTSSNNCLVYATCQVSLNVRIKIKKTITLLIVSLGCLWSRLQNTRGTRHSRSSTSFWSHGHYLFLKAPSLLSENCSLLGTGNVRGEISVHIFAPSGYILVTKLNTGYRTAGWTAGFVELRSSR